MKTRYEFFRNGQFWAGFNEGDATRFGVPMDDATALREFNDCVAHWEGRPKGARYTWELRIIRPASK